MTNPRADDEKIQDEKNFVAAESKRCLKNYEDRSQGHRTQPERAVTKLNNLTIEINNQINRLKPSE